MAPVQAGAGPVGHPRVPVVQQIERPLPKRWAAGATPAGDVTEQRLAGCQHAPDKRAQVSSILTCSISSSCRTVAVQQLDTLPRRVRFSPRRSGPVAHLGERLPCKQEAEGAEPSRSMCRQSVDSDVRPRYGREPDASSGGGSCGVGRAARHPASTRNIGAHLPYPAFWTGLLGRPSVATRRRRVRFALGPCSRSSMERAAGLYPEVWAFESPRERISVREAELEQHPATNRENTGSIPVADA